MSLFNVFQISSQGMTAQRQRLEAAAVNLANSNTTRTAEGGAYRRRDVIFETAEVARNSEASNAVGGFESFLAGTTDDAPTQGVRATMQMAEANDIVKRYEPGHPDADAQGYVSLPNVNPLEETVNMISAARSFEANATAFNTAKELARASLRLGDAS